MDKESLTAKMCLFVKSYHYKNNKYWIYKDNLSECLLGDDYNRIYNYLGKGINYFIPNFKGNIDDGIRYIVNNNLAPSVLGRSVFCDKHLKNEIKLGIKNYLVFASGYDMSPYLNCFHNLNVYEIDQKMMIEDKIRRLKKAKIDYSFVNFIDMDLSNNIINLELKGKSFCSLLGISYYLTKDKFDNLINNISKIISVNSVIVFDYPTMDVSEESLSNSKLASSAGEEMISKYNYNEIEMLLQKYNFLIYEHLDYNEMTNMYFDNYNILNPNNKIIAKKGTSYVLAIKK